MSSGYMGGCSDGETGLTTTMTEITQPITISKEEYDQLKRYKMIVHTMKQIEWVKGKPRAEIEFKPDEGKASPTTFDGLGG